VDWSGAEPSPTEGLRDRKKRLLRQQLSDTATELFLQRGFDAVRVSEVAQACGVSEKTVYNYFPTKESLVLDRGEATLTALRTALADRAVAPLDAVVRILDEELRALTSWLGQQPELVRARASVRRFGELIRSTPSLRAHQHDQIDQLSTVVADLLAKRTGQRADGPQPRIAAAALLGLWEVQGQSLAKQLATTRTPEQLRRAVSADVHRAARLLATGLASYGER
jgi:AcrR family transcriptional regulator